MKYYPVSLDEMRSFLSTNGTWEEASQASTREYVFDTKLSGFDFVVVRIFSSIHKDTSAARRKGGDAIRVCAVNNREHCGWIKSVRVFRVEGWKENLSRAIIKVTREATNRCERKYRRSANEPQQTRSYSRPDAGLPFQIPQARSAEEQELIKHIWGEKSADGYAAEASTLDANKDRRPRNKCPECDGFYYRNSMVKLIKTNEGTEDEEIGGWVFRCPTCGTTLTVFND